MEHHSETAERIYKPKLLANCIRLQLQVNGIRYAKGTKPISTIQGISEVTRGDRRKAKNNYLVQVYQQGNMQS